MYNWNKRYYIKTKYIISLSIQETISFSTFGLTFSFQKCPQLTIQITHVTNR